MATQASPKTFSFRATRLPVVLMFLMPGKAQSDKIIGFLAAIVVVMRMLAGTAHSLYH
jgi:hypothetical protein